MGSLDDNSQDGTQEILEKLKDRYPSQLHVIVRKHERGRGTAGIVGFQKCLELPSDCIMEMDADFSHDPKHIPKFLALIRHYDVVIGSRYVEGGYVSDWTLSRKIVSACSNFIYRSLLSIINKIVVTFKFNLFFKLMFLENPKRKCPSNYFEIL